MTTNSNRIRTRRNHSAAPRFELWSAADRTAELDRLDQLAARARARGDNRSTQRIARRVRKVSGWVIGARVGA